jgi:hypothetical protein
MNNITQRDNKTELHEYQSIETIAKVYNQFSINQLRWIIANKERYGLSNAVKRIGRKIYFHMPSLTEWVEQQNA